MSQNPSIPGLPFDPREKGPFDVARDAWEWTRRTVDENTVELATLGVVLVGLALYFKPEIPTLPNWLVVGLIASGLASGTAWSVGKAVAEALYEPNSVLLSEQNAVNGDQRLIELAPDRFEELRVTNHNGAKRGREFLHEVRINGRRAYEVDRYDAESNVAVASWQAGVSNSEIRREKSRIAKIKTELEREADKALEVMTNNSALLRRQASLVANRLIAVAEDVEVPNGGALHEEMSEMLEDEDPAEALLDDRGDDLKAGDRDDEQASDDEGGVEPDPDGDVFQRAAADAAGSRGGDAVATDGGESREQ